MAVEREDLRDGHRLFGLLLTDFFTNSPFRVDVERDLSVQQQLLDVVIVRRGNTRMSWINTHVIGKIILPRCGGGQS